jgi:hypothetical protein
MICLLSWPRRLRGKGVMRSRDKCKKGDKAGWGGANLNGSKRARVAMVMIG